MNTTRQQVAVKTSPGTSGRPATPSKRISQRGTPTDLREEALNPRQKSLFDEEEPEPSCFCDWVKDAGGGMKALGK